MAIGINNGVLTLGTPLAVLQGGSGRSANYYFCAYQDAQVNNVTGDGTEYTIISNVEINDTGSWYNNATGIATAPVTGFYMFGGNLDLLALAAGNTTGYSRLVTTSNTIYLSYLNPNVIKDGGGSLILSGSSGIYLTAGDTAQLTIAVTGGAKIVDIYGDVTAAHPTYFWGALIST
jgi:hypothetical protein